jgi:hypothetical protein
MIGRMTDWGERLDYNENDASHPRNRPSGWQPPAPSDAELARLVAALRVGLKAAREAGASSLAPAAGSRPRGGPREGGRLPARRAGAATGALDRMVDRAAARIAQEVVGKPSTGARDGVPVALAEKRAILAQMTARTDRYVAKHGSGLTLEVDGRVVAKGRRRGPQGADRAVFLASLTPPGHLTPFGW